MPYLQVTSIRYGRGYKYMLKRWFCKRSVYFASGYKGFDHDNWGTYQGTEKVSRTVPARSGTEDREIAYDSG